MRIDLFAKMPEIACCMCNIVMEQDQIIMSKDVAIIIDFSSLSSVKCRLTALNCLLKFYFPVVLLGKKGQEVLIQGGVIDDVARHLVEQYGVPKRYIEVLDKTRK